VLNEALHEAADENEAKMATNNSSVSPLAKALVGWVLESPGRGTLSLISACVFTIFLCTWVVIHPRVYKWRLFGRLHKIALFLKTIIAPEFIAVEGLQEWSQAQKMVQNCKDWTGGSFKLVQAFYIGMLALRYRTPQGERVIWPNQYTWLLQQGLIDWKDHALWGLSEENIRDKSNADGAVKLAALCQVSWFVAQSIMRTAHALPLSQLESMTLSYIPLFVVTYFFWWLKPKDVITPSVVDLPSMQPAQKTTFEAMAISNAFDDEGTPQQTSLWSIWCLTPRVFEKEAEDKALREVRCKALQQRKAQLRAKEKTEHAVERKHGSGEDETKCSDDIPLALPPKEIVVAHWDPELYRSAMWPAICVFGASFGALHLICWNTIFPTLVERWLWRAAALTSIFSMLVFMHFEKVVFRWGGLMTIISLLSPALYLLSRIVMIGGVIAAFRAADPEIYDTYVVSSYWVHVL
jgi:hypothetical protein